MIEAVHESMHNALREGIFPAAELLVAHQAKIVHHTHYGTAKPGMLFDIASLTKPLVVGTRCAQLVRSGTLDYEQHIGDIIPKLAGTAYETATLAQLLDHQAGFPAWFPFYESTDPQEAGSAATRSYILQQCAAATPAYAPGTGHIYSDLGYLLLGDALETIAGADLAAQFQEHIASPLQLNALAYRPLTARDPSADALCLPTEDCPWRDTIVQGVAHDYHTYALGGVSGIAGLFGTAEDLYHYMTRMGELPTHSWDHPSPQASAAGQHFSLESIGHLGFTGCSLWYDPTTELLVILLSNRIHPSCKNEQIKTFRPRLHDTIAISTL